MKNIISFFKYFLFTLITQNNTEFYNLNKLSKKNAGSNIYKYKYKSYKKKLKKVFRKIDHMDFELIQLRNKTNENEKMINNLSSIIISYISNNI